MAARIRVGVLHPVSSSPKHNDHREAERLLRTLTRTSDGHSAEVERRLPGSSYGAAGSPQIFNPQKSDRPKGGRLSILLDSFPSHSELQ
jgi:hypothetical protein